MYMGVRGFVLVAYPWDGCLRGDMIDIYKIIHNIYDHESVPNLLKNNEISQRTGNRGHSLTLFTQRAKPNLRIFFSNSNYRTME